MTIINGVEIKELEARFDKKASAGSFYGKALVIVNHNTDETILRSYETIVAIRDNKSKVIKLHNTSEYSNTTLRHVKEFLAQNGHGNLTKAQIFKQFDEVE